MFTGTVYAQNYQYVQNVKLKIIEKDSVTKNPYTLVFINPDTAFAKRGIELKQRMEDAFFTVYPLETAAFNSNSAHKVVFVIDPGYDGVAESWSDTVRFNPVYMLRFPADVDVVTHEVMHIVQEYGYSAGPDWLTEGIADYARYKYGVDNKGAGWSMPAYKQGQSYTNGYRITTRFLVWLDEEVKPGIVKDLNDSLHSHAFNNDTWKQMTGKSVDELWSDYTVNAGVI